MEWLDAMRGFTMILVVAYHVAQFGFGQSEKLSASLPFLVLFRMPLFFFVSGFLAYRSRFVWTTSSFLSLTWKKVKIQVLPALVFLCLFLIFRRSHNFFDVFWASMKSPTKSGYWFTWVLLQMFIIYYFTAALSQKLRSHKPVVILWIMALAVYASLYMPEQFGKYWKAPFYMYSSLYETMKFFHFFLLGNIVHRYWTWVQKMFDSHHWTMDKSATNIGDVLAHAYGYCGLPPLSGFLYEGTISRQTLAICWHKDTRYLSSPFHLPSEVAYGRRVPRYISSQFRCGYRGSRICGTCHYNILSLDKQHTQDKSCIQRVAVRTKTSCS